MVYRRPIPYRTVLRVKLDLRNGPIVEQEVAEEHNGLVAGVELRDHDPGGLVEDVTSPQDYLRARAYLKSDGTALDRSEN
jgi:hypothetical protein